MSERKRFDCIEYKRTVQAEHASANAGLRPEEIRKRRSEWLETSDNPAARVWRKLREAERASTVTRDG